VKDVFPAQYSGQYEGALVLATSCLVEAGVMGLPQYLQLLKQVLTTIADRRLTEGPLYFKLHPLQAGNKTNAALYRSAIREAAPGLVVEELPQTCSLEALATGNRISLVTGFSTLTFHVAETGAIVYTYLPLILEIAPGSMNYLPKTGLAIFNRITRPL
jgi:hypothetical protein